MRQKFQFAWQPLWSWAVLQIQLRLINMLSLKRFFLNPSNAETTFLQSTRMQDSWKNIETLSSWYSFESSRRVLSDEYPFARVSVISCFFCIFFVLAKLATSSIRVNPYISLLQPQPNPWVFRCPHLPDHSIAWKGFEDWKLILTKSLILLQIFSEVTIYYWGIIKSSLNPADISRGASTLRG